MRCRVVATGPSASDPIGAAFAAPVEIDGLATRSARFDPRPRLETRQRRVERGCVWKFRRTREAGRRDRWSRRVGATRPEAIRGGARRPVRAEMTSSSSPPMPAFRVIEVTHTQNRHEIGRWRAAAMAHFERAANRGEATW